MTTAIAFNRPEPGRADSEDVLSEVEFVESALASLGHTSTRIPAKPGIDGLLSFARSLSNSRADAVFNLIESLGEMPRLHPAGAALFDIAGIPFTGSPYETLVLTTDKAACKALMQAAGIPTAAWAIYPDTGAQHIWDAVAQRRACIAKPLWEDASVGINDDSVFTRPDDLKSGLASMHARYGRMLVERFAEGAEYNVSIVEGPARSPRVLPIAEMLFRDWPEGKPRIVNYMAKWDPESFEFHNTVREFPDDPETLAPVEAAALHAWRSFGLRGYARVDIRLDSEGSPLVMEINANPCISPDSGFVAAAERAGMSPEELVGGILDAAMAKGGHN